MDELNIPLEDRGFRSLESLRNALADLGREEISSSVLEGNPTLIVVGNREGKEASGLVDQDMLYQRTIDEGDTNVESVYHKAGAPLKKRPGNPFPNMINIGRATNCDIVLLLPTVSKIHAYFQAKGEGVWDLVDCRSRNGTFINGDRLEPGDRRTLHDGDTLRFGKQLTLRFLFPESLCDELLQG